ncbi:hypothetical protein GAN17_16715 [Mycobacterium kubicae]|uniref:alpha/beta hydrolase n=1 Tax=Mycobacterium kubicae TaxID=120959 RepID=UPI00163FA5BD|nr:hypothetical protein [Mycobacterium kubicae]QNI07744.1 hypothetical protein GAN17_16715 [Mycobacterium kubicae]
MTAGYAREMAARGFIALPLDFRTWGQSGGLPRFMEKPNTRIGDIVAAAAFLAQHCAVDPQSIAGLGICAGTSNRVAAAIAALLINSLALVAPATPSRADVMLNLGWGAEVAARIDAATEALAEYDRSGEQALVPAVPLSATMQ